MMFISFTISAALSSALLAFASPAGFSERATPLAQVITKCTVPNTAALTFDDGPYNYIYARALPTTVISAYLTCLLYGF